MKMTYLEYLLAVARTLPATWTAEELTVTAWRDRPDLWGLRGYPQFPDHKNVSIYLYRRKDGLMSLGWIERVGLRRFRVSASREAVEDRREAIRRKTLEANRQRQGRKHDR